MPNVNARPGFFAPRPQENCHAAIPAGRSVAGKNGRLSTSQPLSLSAIAVVISRYLPGTNNIFPPVIRSWYDSTAVRASCSP
jgi:hypothetical protein